MRSRLEMVLIWPKDVALPVRIVDLRPQKAREAGKGLIQVIRGTNETGKSALLSIIDYCLGSPNPTIPHDAIFETVHAYGIVLSVEDKTALLVRSAPHLRVTPEGYHFRIGRDVDVPHAAPTFDATATAYARALDQLLGLDVFQVEPAGEERAARPLAYDLSPFLLAPSDYLTRSSGLFQTGRVSFDRVRKMVPLALQAATGEYVRLSSLLRGESKKLRKLKERLYVVSEALTPVERAIEREYHSAIHQGFVPGDPYLTLPADQLGALADFAHRMAAVDSIKEGADAWRELLARLQELQRRERAAARVRATVRSQLRDVEQILAAATSVDEGHEAAERRLHAFDWFAAHVDHANECPTCGSQSGSALDELLQLSQAIESFRLQGQQVRSLADEYRGQQAALIEELAAADGAYREIIEERVAIETVVGGKNRVSQPVTVSDISRVLGALQSLLGARDQLRQLAEIRENRDALEAQVRGIEESLLHHNFDELFDELEQSLFLHVQYYAELMGLYSASHPVSLTLRNLQLLVEVEGKAGSTRRRLDQLGSGKNWMGYKLSAALAMHELFFKFRDSPVPSFLVVDQLSQVDSSSMADPERETLTLLAFKCMIHAAEMCDLQILALEGMADLSYLRLPDIERVEEWPDDSKLGLIPTSWLPGSRG
jgi:hypothetical protein